MISEGDAAMNPVTPSSAVTLDYAKPQRRLNWRGLGVFALIGFLIVAMCFNLVGVAFYVFWPVKYTSVEVLTAFGSLSPTQLAQHRSAMTSPQFLAPIAGRNGVSVKQLQSDLTVTQAGTLVRVEFTSRDPAVAAAVASDMAITYSKQSGLTALFSTPRNPPLTKSAQPLQILSQTVAAAFGLLAVIFLTRTNWGRRWIWLP